MRQLICVVALVAFLAAAGCSGTPSKPVHTAPGGGPGEKSAQPTAPPLGQPPPR